MMFVPDSRKSLETQAPNMRFRRMKAYQITVPSAGKALGRLIWWELPANSGTNKGPRWCLSDNGPSGWESARYLSCCHFSGNPTSGRNLRDAAKSNFA